MPLSKQAAVARAQMSYLALCRRREAVRTRLTAFATFGLPADVLKAEQDSLQDLEERIAVRKLGLKSTGGRS